MPELIVPGVSIPTSVHDGEIRVWTAINRPTPTALHVLCAHDLASLAVKLGSAGDRGTG